MIKNKYGNEISMSSISNAYGDYRNLYNFYLEHKDIVSANEMRERIEYIKKYGVKQRTEIETLCWVLGESIIGEKE